jgi:hypothetical protein
MHPKFWEIVEFGQQLFVYYLLTYLWLIKQRF